MELGLISGVGQTAGPQAVAQGQGDVVIPGDLQELIVFFIQRIFPAETAHPGGEKGPAPGDHAGDPFFQERQGGPGDAAVHRDEVHPLAGVVAHHLQEGVALDFFQALGFGHQLVDGHGAEGRGALGQQGGADGVQVAAGGQVHDRVGPVLQGRGQLGLLLLQVDVVGRSADIGVDLDPDAGADGHRLQALMARIGRDHQGALGQARRRITSGAKPSAWAACSMSGVIRPANAASRCVMRKFYLNIWENGRVGGELAVLPARTAPLPAALRTGRGACPTCRPQFRAAIGRPIGQEGRALAGPKFGRPSGSPLLMGIGGGGLGEGVRATRPLAPSPNLTPRRGGRPVPASRPLPETGAAGGSRVGRRGWG